MLKVLYIASVVFCSHELPGGCIEINVDVVTTGRLQCEEIAERYQPTTYIANGSLPASIWRYANFCKVTYHE